jgi:uroporphyrinogen decarboxylase
MISRRYFLAGVSAAVLRGASMTPCERVKHALRGEDVDRTPFSFWHHFLDADKSAESHAQSTLAFHRQFHTDVVKVMSDYPYPKPKAEWFEPRVEANPFPTQIRSLQLIRAGLGGKVYFLETIFNPWQIAEKLSSHEDVMALMQDKPQRLLDALEVFAKSEANHARLAVKAGAAGVFVSITNAQAGTLTEEQYGKFSEPFDKMVFDAVKSAPFNVLHLHTDAKYGDHLYAKRFFKGWSAAAINYTVQGTGLPVVEMRKEYSGVIMAGLDERKYRQLTVADLKEQSSSARAGAGKKFILAPGCSVPNDSTDGELAQLPELLGAV